MSFSEQRQRMVREQLLGRGIEGERLLSAFEKIPREVFIPEEYQAQAYEDHPIPIGFDQTASQPYIIALMISHLHLKGDERILEIGTGSGYQTALLACLCAEVFSVERIAELSAEARARLDRLSLKNVHIKVSDGSFGWKEHAPFDGIIVSAASPDIPQPLLDQLAIGGCMVLPVGSRYEQELIAVERARGAIHQRQIGGCVFVPLIGQYGWPETVN